MNWKAMKVDPAKAKWCVRCIHFHDIDMCKKCQDMDMRGRPLFKREITTTDISAYLNTTKG